MKLHLYLLAFLPLFVTAQKYDAVLKQQLDSIHTTDQEHRHILAQFDRLDDATIDSLKKVYHAANNRSLEMYLWEVQKGIDKSNLAFIEQVIKKHGYPGKTMVGEETSSVAWLVIQHSDKISTYFPIIQKAGEEGELRMSSVGMMHDRLLTEQDKPQLYGTQGIGVPWYDSAAGEMKSKTYMWPVDNPAMVNKRRKEAGFYGTVEDVAETLHAIYEPTLTVAKLKEMRKVSIQKEAPYNEQIKVKIKEASKLTEELEGSYISNSTFVHLHKADSLLKTGDTAGAGEHIVLVSPYHLIYKLQTPKTIEDFLNKYQGDEEAKEKYISAFNEVYNNPKAAIYDTFRRHYINIEKLRYELVKAKPTERATLEARVAAMDKMHGEHLYQYYTEYGWPSLAEGSLYAGYLATRDVWHYYDHVINMIPAYKQGQIDMAAINATDYNRASFSNYYELEQDKKQGYVAYDVTMMLYGAMMPEALQQKILNDVKGLCPIVKSYYVYECTDSLYKIGTNRHWWEMYGEQFEDQVINFARFEIYKDCPDLKETNQKGPTLYYQGTHFVVNKDLPKERLRMYIFYKGS